MLSGIWSIAALGKQQEHQQGDSDHDLTILESQFDTEDDDGDDDDNDDHDAHDS